MPAKSTGRRSPAVRLAMIYARFIRMQSSLALYWMHLQFRPRLKSLELIVAEVPAIAAKRKHTLSRGFSALG